MVLCSCYVSYEAVLLSQALHNPGSALQPLTLRIRELDGRVFRLFSAYVTHRIPVGAPRLRRQAAKANPAITKSQANQKLYRIPA